MLVSEILFFFSYSLNHTQRECGLMQLPSQPSTNDPTWNGFWYFKSFKKYYPSVITLNIISYTILVTNYLDDFTFHCSPFTLLVNHHLPRLLLQVDPAHMVIARNMVAYAGMAHMIDIWTGHSGPDCILRCPLRGFFMWFRSRQQVISMWF